MSRMFIPDVVDIVTINQLNKKQATIMPFNYTLYTMHQSPNPSLTNHQSNPPYSESGGNDLTKLYPPISITPTPPP